MSLFEALIKSLNRFKINNRKTNRNAFGSHLLSKSMRNYLLLLEHNEYIIVYNNGVRLLKYIPEGMTVEYFRKRKELILRNKKIIKLLNNE